MSVPIEKIRSANLLKLIARFKDMRAFSVATGINDTYISHIRSGKRNLGTTLCRRIENALGLSDGWMDTTH